jgi:hypothetical protein
MSQKLLFERLARFGSLRFSTIALFAGPLSRFIWKDISRFPSRGSKSAQIAIAVNMSISLGNQRMGCCKKPSPLRRVGGFQGARDELCSLQAQRDTVALVRWWIVGLQGRSPD